MELTGETAIAAPRARVWAALNDPAVLARAIEGCESLTAASENRFEGRVATKIGPVRATFAGTVTLSEIDPPNGYTLTGEGKGGAAGFAKGGARVTLSDGASGGTHLAYTATASVGGKLAQLGGRLIEGAARAQADKFFTALKAELERPADAGDEDGGPDAAPPADPPLAAGAAPAVPVPAEASPPASTGLSMTAWSAILIALALALLAALLFA